MTVIESPPPKAFDLATKDRGVASDIIFKTVALVAGVSVLAVLGLIAVSTTVEAMPAFLAEGLSFFTSSRWAPSQDVFGGLAFIYGTAVVSLISIVIAVPLSIGIALFTTELVPRRIRSSITTVIDLLAAIPSVVYGLWGIAVLAPNIVGVYDGVAGAVEPIPGLNAIFGTGATGRSLMTAGIILSLMVIPIVTSVTREVFATVPQGEKDAALALGATRWEMIRGAVFPHSFGGLVGAVMLGLGRAMGETIAIALTIGSAIQISSNLFKSGSAMPEVIVLQWGESSGTHRSALIALGVTLFVVTILVNVAARSIVGRAERKMRGA